MKWDVILKNMPEEKERNKLHECEPSADQKLKQRSKVVTKLAV